MATGKDRQHDPVSQAPSRAISSAEISAGEVRRQAEDKARKIPSINPEALSPEEIRKLHHELCVHQIELAMQNDELRRTQEDLEASRARYFDLYDMAPIGYVSFDREQLIIEANLRAATLLGVAKGELTKTRLNRWILPEDQDIHYRHYKQLLESGELQAYDLRMVRRDGSMLWARMTTTLAHDANGDRVCRATIGNISARKEAEGSLVLFRTLLDQANDAIEVIDAETGRLLDVNEKVCSMLGYTREELLAMAVPDIDPAISLPQFMENSARLRQNAITTLRFESLHRRKDGSTFPVEVNLRRIQLDREYALAITRDITERKQHEERRRRLMDALLQSQTKLRALVGELSKAEERERRRLAAELHDGLAQTLTLSRMWLGRAGGMDSPDEVKKVLAEAQQSIDASIEYTRSLMAQLSPRVLYDLGLPAALAWLGDRMRRQDLAVEVAGEPDDFELDEDHAVLAFQCTRELLWNVAKHAGANRAKVFYRLRDGELTIEVTDDGNGFDPDQVTEQVGEPEKFGLFSIGERLELHGGRLDVRSVLGQGTCARLSVPVDQVQRSSITLVQPAVTVSTAATGQQLRVALVDDHPVLRDGLRKVLEPHADLTVVGEAKDGLDAIEMAREVKPNVIVMDVNMPRMNGIQATKRILEEFPDTIVVGLSVASDGYIEQGMKKAGASACVTKERAGEEIYTTIMKAVQDRRAPVAH